jgi:long-chain fatty acid transport protein
MSRRRVATFALAVLFVCARAEAGGFYFTDRGVRPAGRGGAFIAGADDPSAAWYNPAGLADSGTSILADFAVLRFSPSYTRQLLVLTPDGYYQSVRSPTLSGDPALAPFPGVIGSYAFGAKKQWTLAAGVFAPYVALSKFPSTVAGQPSPARYALGEFDGTVLVFPGAWLAYKPIEELRLGAGLMALAGTFASRVTFSANPQERLFGAAEAPDFDTLAQLEVGPIFAPTANAGVTWVPTKLVRFGLSGQAPARVSAPAKITLRLPTAAVFDRARQGGDDANVAFTMPAILRIGAEVRPWEELRVEAAYVREFWSMHDTIDITPENVSIDGATALPPRFIVPPFSIPRGYQDSNSFRLGLENRVRIAKRDVDMRTGANYETSAVPPSHLSLSSLDFDKLTLSLGAGIHASTKVRIDFVYGHVFAQGETVDPRDGRIPRINPVPGNARFEAVNGGRYSASADVFGLGVVYRTD